LSKQ